MDIEQEINDIQTAWKPILLQLVQPYKDSINIQLTKDYNRLTEDYIFPPKHLIFNAFQHFNPNQLKVLILGQDTYHNPDEANGLCFSVNQGIKIPPSLNNIFKELNNSYGTKRTNTDLTDWANQGVLLLNVGLTVTINKPLSHINIWKSFVNDILDYINININGICIMAWGNFAKEATIKFDRNENLVLTHTHPSPLSRKPFVGCNHFKLCNDYLKNKIEWI